MSKDALREELAAYAHEAWIGWMKYFFLKCEPHVPYMESGNGYWFHLKMPTELYERWKRQMSTEYERLPEGEKKSDREEADKMMSIMSKYIEELEEENEKLRRCVREASSVRPIFRARGMK